MDLATAVQWILVIFLAGVALIILIKMYNGKIPLNMLISEADGKASLSRFQFLLFTFGVVGIWIVLCFKKSELVEISNGVLGLIGISGGSFVISKGIQQQTDQQKIQAGRNVPANAHVPPSP